jgi:gliding motility-associated-like protein
MGDGTSFIDSTNLTYTYTTAGNYTVTFEAYDFECNVSDTITEVVNFNPLITQVNTNIDPLVEVCGSDLAVDFSSGNPAPPQNYWYFGDGNTSTQIDPTHTYPSSNTYNGFFVAIDSTTCNIADTLPFTITVNLIPELDVNLDYTPPIPCEAVSYEVNLEANVEGADSIYWNMGDGMEFYNDTIIAYEYGSPGTYPITITLFKEGCPPKVISSAATFIELGESSGIIPNVFTPNGDGMNDELVFLGIDQTQDYSIRIFNRWGKTVFESSDAKDNWDGKDSKDGTYFYELRYTDVCSNEEKLVTGTVTLIGKN